MQPGFASIAAWIEGYAAAEISRSFCSSAVTEFGIVNGQSSRSKTHCEDCGNLSMMTGNVGGRENEYYRILIVGHAAGLEHRSCDQLFLVERNR